MAKRKRKTSHPVPTWFIGALSAVVVLLGGLGYGARAGALPSFEAQDLDYRQIKGLRLEAVEKLGKIRPVSLGQASRISGVSPADLSVLVIYLEQRRQKGHD